MANFLRESKYKNIVVDGYPKEACYEQLRTVTSTISSDSNMLTANSKFFAYIDSSGGGSAVGVLPYSSVGKNHVPITSTAYQQPIIRAHSGTVNDLTFNPFDKNQLLTCSNDGTIRTWNIPGEGLVSDCTECVTQFQHSSGVASMGLSFHPCVDGVLASRGAKEISVFDCYSSQEVFCYDKFAHDIHSFAIAPHSHNIIGITSKDKMLSLIDMRNNEAVKRTELHQGTRGTRLCWLGEHSNMLVTTGHSKSNQDRELFVWDNRNLEKPVNTTRLDSSTGVVMPFYDYDTNLLCLFGKGDATMKVFEYDALIESNTDNDSFSTFKGMHPLVNVIPTGCSNTDITRGAAILPKQCNDLMKCEVIKCLRLYENRIQPISCRVIRNEKTKFHQDLYPPTVCEASPVASSKTNMDWLNSKFQKCNTVELKAPIPVSITPTKSAQEMSSSSNSPISPKVASIRSSIGAGASKFKNVYGTENTKAHIYFNLKPITTGGCVVFRE